MKMLKNKIVIILGILIAFLTFLPGIKASAGDYDRILLYETDIVVNEDATLNIKYHIKWKLLEPLENTSEFKVFWVKIGVPNNHCDIVSYSSNVESAKLVKDKGTCVRLNFFKRYEKNEIVDFSFEIHQDYMYDIQERGAVYVFTPGWFKDIKVDTQIIRWDDKAGLVQSASPAYKNEDGILTWTKNSLGHDERQTITVKYNTDAFQFDTGKYHEDDHSKSYQSGDDDSAGEVVGGMIFFCFIIFVIVGCVISALQKASYNSTANLGTTKKITRTKIEYYPSCPGCGAPRPEGKENCEYCGRSFIKSEEKIEEKDIPKEETELKSKSTSGVYRYHSSPNTYLRVNVINIPASRPTTRSGGSRGGCVHSSCACASHCACACACACAGGGRAGCSTKDFYNTNLKHKFFERMKNRK
jgi:hypothetical protein